MRHNLLLLLSVPVVTVLALAIALILHEGIRGWRIYRTVVFMPYMLAIPVLGSTFLYLLGLNGVLNSARATSASATSPRTGSEPRPGRSRRSPPSSSTTSSASAWCSSWRGC